MEPSDGWTRLDAAASALAMSDGHTMGVGRTSCQALKRRRTPDCAAGALCTHAATADGCSLPHAPALSGKASGMAQTAPSSTVDKADAQMQSMSSGSPGSPLVLEALQLPELEALLSEGDPHTWQEQDWLWDGTSLRASPLRDVPVVSCSALRSCGNAERAAPDVIMAAQGAAAAAAAAKPAHVQSPATASNSNESEGTAAQGVSSSGASAAEQTQQGSTLVATIGISSHGGYGKSGCCQVPGCDRPLGHLKDYHQRYRICDVHIKLPQVIKDGRLQRFCQQCSHFHGLDAFDGSRRSCREQLAAHNARRRRRAQPNKPRADLSGQQDQQQVTAEQQEQRHGKAAHAEPKQQSARIAKQQQQQQQPNQAGKSGKQQQGRQAAQQEQQQQGVPVLAPGLTGGLAMLPPPPQSLPHCMGQAGDMFSHCMPLPQGMPAPPVMLPGLMLPVPPPQMLPPGLATAAMPPAAMPQQQHLPSFPEPMDQQQQQQAGQQHKPQAQQMLMPSDVSAAPAAASAAPAGPAAEAAASQESGQQQQQKQKQEEVPSFQEAAALFQAVAVRPERLPALKQVLLDMLSAPPPSTASSSGSAAGGPSGPGASYVSPHRIIRLSAKLFNCTPADLPSDLRQQMAAWLGQPPLLLEGYIRPGCVLLTVHMLLAGRGEGSSDTGMLDKLLSTLVVGGGPGSIWKRGTALLQLGTEVAVVQHGTVLQRATYSRELALQQALPVLLNSAPVVISTEAASAAVGPGGPLAQASFCLQGYNLVQPDVQVIVRSGGQHVRTAGLLPLPSLPGGCQQVQVVLPPLPPGCHLLHVELQKGGYLSTAVPVLLVGSSKVAEEIHKALAAAGPGVQNRQAEHWASVAEDLGLVLQYADKPVGGAGAQQLEDLHRHMGTVARGLLQFTCEQGMGSTAQELLSFAVQKQCCV